MSFASGLPEALGQRWMRFWFYPSSPLNLGLCRALFFGALFILYYDVNFARWAESPASTWIPVWIFELLHLPLLPAGALAAMHVALLVSLGLACLGLFTRVSTASSLVLGLYLVGLSNNFGKVSHSGALAVFVIGIMALSRCGDAFSLDRLIWRRGERESDSGEYTWPVRAVWVLFALIFFGAGSSKLRHSGLEWVFSDNLAILLIHAQLKSDDLLLPLGFLSEYPWLILLLAAGTIVIEVGYPLVLVSRPARLFWVPGAFFMQVGISLSMDITFKEFFICNLFWIPWDRVFHGLASLYERSPTQGTAAKEQ